MQLQHPAGIQVQSLKRMRLMQRIGRIVPGALSPPLHKQNNCLVLARGEYSAPGTIGPIRSFRRIRFTL
jgi:hypothetical protein